MKNKVIYNFSFRDNSAKILQNTLQSVSHLPIYIVYKIYWYFQHYSIAIFTCCFFFSLMSDMLLFKSGQSTHATSCVSPYMSLYVTCPLCTAPQHGIQRGPLHVSRHPAWRPEGWPTRLSTKALCYSNAKIYILTKSDIKISHNLIMCPRGYGQWPGSLTLPRPWGKKRENTWNTGSSVPAVYYE